MTCIGRRVLVVADDFLVSLATIDVLESMGCEIVGSPARLSAAVQIAKSESFDAAVLDTTLAGEMVWPLAVELQRKDVPFVFLSVIRHTIFPGRLAHAPRFGKPLDQQRLARYFHKIWGENEPVILGEPVRSQHHMVE